MGQTAVTSPVGLKNILVATDDSPISSRAISFAGGLAARFDAKLYALHAGEPVNYALPPQSWKESEEASRIAAQELSRSLRATLPRVKSEILEGEGPAWSAINRAIAEKEIDLLVLGTRGRTGVTKLLLGSVAEEILRRATCPVLTLGPFAQLWDEISLERPEIIYATDFSPEAYAAAPHAFAWAGELRANLTLLHVIHDGANVNFARPMEPADAANHLLKRMLPEDAGSRFAYTLHVEHGDPAERILNTAERIRAALIVIGARTPAGVPGAATHLSTSTVHQVIARAPCVVLTAG